MAFSEIIGQDDIKNHLMNAIEKKKVSHAYIINGEAGMGKKMLADAFARTLLCETGGRDACEICSSCKKAKGYNHPDIIYVSHEKPNTISVNDIRLQINGTISVRPYSSFAKIYIVDEAEKMNEAAQNALLKTIEEPPEYAIILLLTKNADIFLPTITSRCVLLNLKPVKEEQVMQHLMKHCEVPDYQAKMCVAFCQGNVGKAMELATGEDFTEMKSHCVSLMKRIPSLTYYEMVDAVKKITEYKLDVKDYFDFMTVWFRDVLLYKATADTKRLVFVEEAYHIRQQAMLYSFDGLENILTELDNAGARIRANVSFELVIELLLEKMKENLK